MELFQSKKIVVLTDFSRAYYVETDSYLFSIIINNLILNALKYSTVNDTLNVKIVENGAKIECHIIDSGMGIRKEDLEKIFNPFYRSNSTDHPEIKGTGLGLSIVKRLCSLLSIKIDILSQEGIGTNVILTVIEA